jgi:ribosomal protein L11 methyltransferase
MGFGTGHHETTRLCLALLQERPMTGCTVLDVGTGSGVLAVAAWRLGATRVFGIDCDPVALEAARDTLARNGATAAVMVDRHDLGDGPRAPFDLVTANLTGAVLERHASTLTACLAPHGAIIASGFQPNEAADVAGAFAAAGLVQTAQMQEADWIAGVFAKESAGRAARSTGHVPATGRQAIRRAAKKRRLAPSRRPPPEVIERTVEHVIGTMGPPVGLPGFLFNWDV